MGRRSFLAGLGGLLVALPVLESVGPRRAYASSGPPFLISFVGPNGVQQRPRFGGPHADEPEGFWPGIDLHGGRVATLTAGSFPQIVEGDPNADRAVHELRGLEPDISVLRGVRMNEIDHNHHESRRVQILTGSAYNMARPDRQAEEIRNVWAPHESLDARLCREIPGGRPVLAAKNHSAYMLSFEERSGVVESPRATENPMALFDAFFLRHTGDAATSTRSGLATDLVARQITALRRDPSLSAADRVRLDRHFEYLHATETALACATPDLASDRLRYLRESQQIVPDVLDDGTVLSTGSPQYGNRYYPESVTNAFLEIFALGAACGALRAATLVPDGFYFSHTDVFPEGPERDRGFPTWSHNISHRTLSRSDSVDSWSGVGVREHHHMDRWSLRRFRFLIERLRDLEVLDNGVCMYTNEIATGAHEATDIPVILAGRGGGALRTGVYADLQRGADRESQLPNNRLLNTIGAALGLRSPDGAPLHDFGGIRPDGTRDAGGFVDPIVNF